MHKKGLERVFNRSRSDQDRSNRPKLISLFSGAGGLDLGFLQAGFQIALAIDSFQAAIDTHKKNALSEKCLCLDLEHLGAEGVRELVAQDVPFGSSIGIIGGPPCQGFSRANNRSKTNDPRNSLAKLYLDIVGKLREFYDVQFVVFENVQGIRDKKHQDIYSFILAGLSSNGFSLSELLLSSDKFCVPQKRTRVVLVGQLTKGHLRVVGDETVKPVVRDVIWGLPDPVFFKRGMTPSDIPFHPNHWTMQPKSKRFKNESLDWPPSRSFKRLEWDKPSPTIAFGNREIHVHPDGRRRLSIFEAMKLQGFPDDFVLVGNLSQQVTQISNAVPPPMAYGIASALSETVQSLEEDLL